MVSFVTGPVEVSVPATSANLGPGFDSLGMALGLRDELWAEVIDAGVEIEVSGEGAGEVPIDDSHLVVRAMRAAFDLMGGQPPGVRLRCHNVIPHTRGLGSSSAALVAGVCLARALVTDGESLLGDADVFQLLATMEGHPDNVAPAFFGGFTISGVEGTEFYSITAAVDPAITTVVFVPPFPLSTELARSVLPEHVAHAAAAANSGRAALLVAALAGRPDQLFHATKDFLHQDFRRQAMPESHALMTDLRADGIAAVISGAGPTVLAFCAPADADRLAACCPDGWAVHSLPIDTAGVRVLPAR